MLSRVLSRAWRGRAVIAMARCDIRFCMSYESALEAGRLDEARSILDDLAGQPDMGDLWLPECYADVAEAFDRRGQHEDAIAAMERAIEHGWSGRPHPRSDIAEFHLRAGRRDEAARIWAELKAEEPEEIWLYNAAGLSYSEVGDHELAVAWLGEGIELAIRMQDAEGIVPQLSDIRRRSLEALGRAPDMLEERADEFVAGWRRPPREPPSFAEVSRCADQWLVAARAAGKPVRGDREVALALAWFPAGEYEKAIGLWESVAEDWAGVAHSDYCRRMDGHIKWMGVHGVRIRAVAPMVVDDYIKWCEEHGEDPEDARARYAADVYRLGGGIDWPPQRNQPCWCGSDRKYKKCCGTAHVARMRSGRTA